MSRRLVVPVGDTADSPCGYDSMVNETTDANGRVISRMVLDPDRAQRTWADIARENGCVDDNGAPMVEPLDSEWCVANMIDGLGVCTEDSGQNPPPPPPPAPEPVVSVQALTQALDGAATFEDFKKALTDLLDGAP